MKIALIVFKGVQGNTLKLAQFLQEKHPEVELFLHKDAPTDLSNYDLIGFGAAPYAFKWPVPMMNYLETATLKENQPFFLFSTSASGAPFNGKAKKLIKKKGGKYLSSFCIRGYAVLGKAKLNKNRPNEKDLNKGLKKFEKILAK